MPLIYITEETRKALDALIVKEKRPLSAEIEFLVTERAKKIDSELKRESPSVA